MDKETKSAVIKNLDMFDEEISLYRLVACGNGKALEHLKYIRDSMLNSCDVERGSKPHSILISGRQGKRTHARGLLNALCIENVKEMAGNMLNNNQEYERFFSLSNESTGYIISDISLIPYELRSELIRVLRKGYFDTYNPLQRSTTSFPISGTIVIMTSYDTKLIFSETLEQIDHIVELEDYTLQQRIDAIKQRINACNVVCERDDVIKHVAGKTELLSQMIRYIKVAMTIMLADGRRELLLQDLKKAVKFM